MLLDQYFLSLLKSNSKLFEVMSKSTISESNAVLSAFSLFNVHWIALQNKPNNRFLKSCWNHKIRNWFWKIGFTRCRPGFLNVNRCMHFGDFNNIRRLHMSADVSLTNRTVYGYKHDKQWRLTGATSSPRMTTLGRTLHE